MYLFKPTLFYFLVLLCCATFRLDAQTNVEDSLIKKIPTLKDTIKLEAMKQLTYLAGQDNNAAEKYVENLLYEAQKQNNLFYQSFALAKKVELYYSQFNSDSVFIFARQFEEFCESHHFFEHYFIVENIIVQRYCNQEQFTLALNKAQKVYEKAKINGNWLAISRSLMNLGIAYSEIGNPTEAIRVVNEATLILKKQMTKGEKDVAVRLMEAYLNMVTYYENKKDYKMMSLYSDTLQFFIHQTKNERPNFDLSLYRYYAEVFEVITNSKLNDLTEAKLHLQKANQMINPTWGDNIKLLLWQVSAIYHETTGEYGQALAYSDSALQFSIRNNLGLSIKANLLQNAVLLGKMGRYQQSAQTYANLKEVTDSLNSARYASQISELKTIYELDKAEFNAQKAKLKLKNSRILATLLSGIVAILIAFVFVILNNQKKLKAKNRLLFRQIKDMDKLQAEQELHKQQAIPVVNTDDELFNRLEKLMKDEKLYIQSDLSRKNLADKLNTNETYLFESIRNNAGITFSEYITNLRLNYAREILSQPSNEFTIEAIAIDSGFGSRNTFHRLFREKYGLTPVEFRKLVNENSI